MGHVRTVGIATAGVIAVTLGLSTLLAQSQPAKPGQPETKGKEVTLSGKIVDLHCFMTGVQHEGEAVRCTQKCLEEGVPAALDTDSELFLLGKGTKGIGREVARHSLGMVEIRGRLFEKHGVKYLDVSSVKQTSKAEPEEGQEDWSYDPDLDP